MTHSSSPAASAAPARRRVSAQEIAEGIVSLLESGVFHPGDRLREQELADRFQVSRGPVREALRILEATSIVRIEPMRGATLARLSDQEAIDSIEASAVLFGLIAQRAAERCEPEGLARARTALQQLVQLMNTQASPKSFFQQTLRIGQRICEICGSERLQKLVVDVRYGAPDHFGPLGFTTPQLREQAVQDWTALIAAIAAGDGLAARDLAITLHHRALQAALEITR